MRTFIWIRSLLKFPDELHTCARLFKIATQTHSFVEDCVRKSGGGGGIGIGPSSLLEIVVEIMSLS